MRNTTDCQVPSRPATDTGGPPSRRPPLHRLAHVRRRQGVALRTVARTLNISIEEAARQESEQADLPLSVLYQWQKVLEVPLAELLAEENEELSQPVRQRARLVKAMKTAVTIRQRAEGPRMRRLADRLVAQLIEIMPELAGIGPGHDSGSGRRRRRDELGRIAERQFPSRLPGLDSDEAA